MSFIGAAVLFPRDVPSPFTDWSDAHPPSTKPSPAPSGWHGHRDAATRIDLSDKVKGILARASKDQGVADRLEAFVEAHRINIADGSAPDTSSDRGSGIDVNQAFEQLSGGIPAADDWQDLQPPQAGTTGEFSGFTSFGANVAVQAYQRGNKAYITISESEIAATGIAASSDAGAVSATSAGVHTEAVTFAVDFNTGAISVTQSESTSVSTDVRIGQPTSSFSTFA